jgi:hypothetical protein
VIERAYIHVAGPVGAGKTTFVETVLRGVDRWWLAARCVRNDSLRQARETSAKSHPELRRYRAAGATAAALFEFPGDDIGSDEFFLTHLMEDYSQGVVIEGDNPLGFVNLRVYVAPALPAGESLFVRYQRDRAKEERDKADTMERLLRKPGGPAELLEQLVGAPLADFMRQHNATLEHARADFLAAIAKVRNAPPPKPTKHWAVGKGYEGIEHAQLAVVNIRNQAERKHGERLLGDLSRLRREPALFDDVLGVRGTKVPITAVVANLSDPKDAGLKKALSRVGRAVRGRS